MKAGKIAVQRINDCFSRGVSFNQETTLCGHSIIRNIERAKKLGYIVELFYVGVDSVQIAKDRVAKRVNNGGHGIPEADIERRYVESLDNLSKVVELCNLVSLYDNTSSFRRFAIYKNGRQCLLSRNIPEWFKNSNLYLDIENTEEQDFGMKNFNMDDIK